MQEPGQLVQVEVGSGNLPKGQLEMQVLSLRKKLRLHAVQLVVIKEQAAQFVPQVSQVYATLLVIEFNGHVVSQIPPLL